MALVNGREVVLTKAGQMKPVEEIERELGKPMDIENELAICGCEILDGPPKHVLPMALFYANERKDGNEMMFTVQTTLGKKEIKLRIKNASPESGGGENWCLDFHMPSSFRGYLISNAKISVFYKTRERTGRMSLE